MQLILVRHGQTTSNLTHALDTRPPGAELTDLGREQARAAAERLKDERVDAILVSRLVRTQQTAAPLAERLDIDVSVHDGLNEASAGSLEMRADRPAVRAYLNTYLAWIDGDLSRRMPGGQTGREVVSLVDDVIADIEDRGADSVVAFTHGATLRTWCSARVRNLDRGFIAANPILNGGAVLLEGSQSDGWSARYWQGHALGGVSLDSPQPDAASAAVESDS
jgi:broad specificity phosphatase PhoE